MAVTIKTLVKFMCCSIFGPLQQNIGSNFITNQISAYDFICFFQPILGSI